MLYTKFLRFATEYKKMPIMNPDLYIWMTDPFSVKNYYVSILNI